MNVLSSSLSRMSRISRLSFIFAGFGLVAFAGPVACERVPLLAPTGTVINLTLATDVAALNSSVDVIAVLIENGSSPGTGTGTSTSAAAAGTPVQNGTVVSFTTTIGTIEPAEAKTQNGRVNVKLLTNGQSGKATITAYSGGAKSTAQITIGAAAVERVLVSAAPANLGSGGGTTTISAKVEDINGNPLAGVPVQFAATKGTFSAQSAVTNSNGIATTTLSTTAAADVTATAGAKTSAILKVDLATLATVALVGPSSSFSVSSPAQFTVTAGTVRLTNVSLNFGDGDATPPVTMTPSQAQTYQHFFDDDDVFTVKVTGNDPDGALVQSQIQVAVTRISATVAMTQPASGGSFPKTSTGTVTFAANSSNASIDRYVWDFGDGTAPVTSFGTSQSHSYAAAGTYTVTVTIYPSHGSSFPVTTTVTVPS
jgi:hypothetical protein